MYSQNKRLILSSVRLFLATNKEKPIKSMMISDKPQKMPINLNSLL